MIQRIQTLFLLVVLVLSSLMLTGDLIVMNDGSGTMFSISFSGLGNGGDTALQRLWPVTAILAIVPALTLFSVFLFRNRKLQMRIVMFIILLSLGTIILGAFYIIMFNQKIDITIVWKVKALFPLINAILSWLAYRNILKDDLLVRSYDRLR